MGLRGGASRWAVVFIHQQAVGNRVGSCDKVSLPTQIRHLLTVGMTVGDGLRPAECHTHGYIQDALAGMEQSHPLSSTTIAYLWRREPFGVPKYRVALCASLRMFRWAEVKNSFFLFLCLETI